MCMKPKKKKNLSISKYNPSAISNIVTSYFLSHFFFCKAKNAFISLGSNKEPVFKPKAI